MMFFFNTNSFAQRNITISTSATSGGAWSGADPDVFTPNADNANILNTEIQTRLATKGVTITTAGGGSQAGDVVFSTTVTAAPTVNSKTFTVTAAGSITVNASSAITLTPATATTTKTGTNLAFNAGTGISISSAITTTGGNITAGNNADGGAGGSIVITSTTGNVSTVNLTSTGGSASNWGAGGIGGAISITAANAAAISTGIIISTGGNAVGSFSGGAGGNVTIADHSGTTTITSITAKGGTSGNAGAGAAGGIIRINATTPTGGNVSIGAIDNSGSNAGGNNCAGGAGGAITIKSSTGTVSCSSTITSTGGTALYTSAGGGGAGGVLTISASSNVTITGAVNLTGGSLTGNTATGGAGGAINLTSSAGSVTCSSTLTSVGGTGNGATGGAGGSLTIAASTNLTIGGAVNLTGGLGTGNWAKGGAGGTVNITATIGNLSTVALTTSGGIADSWEKGGAGGNIGITANGATTVGIGAITTSGGNSAGNDYAGGNGGSFSISATSAALTSTSAITTRGGNGGANNSAGGTGGAITIATSTVSITGGVTISSIGGTKSGTGTSTGGAVSLTGSAGITLGANITTTATTTNGLLTINDGNNTTTSGGANDGQTAGVLNCGSVVFEKTGSGNFVLSQNNTYTGDTKITAGTLSISAADRISNSSKLVLNGGTFSTGVSTGYNETVGTLNLNANSTIALGTGAHTLTISNSSAVGWAGSTLTITGWTGAGGVSGTAGKIFVGVGGLSAAQLAKVSFSGYSGVSILGTGELVPNVILGTTYYSKSTGDLDVLGTWGTATDGSGTAPTDFVSNNCTYNIHNNATPTIGAAWTVAGTGSKIIVGNGTDACNFTIPSGFALTTTSPAVIDVSAGSTLTIANTTIPTFGTLNATSTVDYAVSTGGQTVTGTTYGNLKLTNTSGTQTAGGNLTVNGTLLTTNGGTLDFGTAYTLAGTLATITNGGIIKTSVPTATSATPLPTGKTWGGTIQYAAATGAQTIMSGTYNNLTLSNSSGTNTAAGNVTVNATLTTTASGIFDLSTNQLLGTLSTITNNGTIKTSCTNNPAFLSGKDFGSAGTVEFAVTTGGQYCPAGTFNHLTFDNSSGITTAVGNITVNGTLTTTASGMLDMGTNTLSGTLGTITNAGTIKTSNTSSTPIPTSKTWGGIIQYGSTSGSQTVVAGTYTTLTTLNTSGTNTVGGNFSTSGTFTTTAGGTLSIPCGLTITTTSTFTNAGIIIGPAGGGTSCARIVNSSAVSNSGTIGSATTYLVLSGTITGGTVINDGTNVKQSSAQVAVCGLTPPVLTAAVGATVDAAFNLTYTDDAAWRAAITSITIGGVTLTAGFSFTAGMLTLTPSASTPTNLLQTSGSKSIVVKATGYDDALVTQLIDAGTATKLAMSTQPPGITNSGSVLSSQPVVLIQDQYGNTTTSIANVVATVGAGGWTIGGTTTKAGVSGIATFTNLTASNATAVNGCTITFTSAGLTSVTSSSFNIVLFSCNSATCTPVSGATVTAVASTEYCLIGGSWNGNFNYNSQANVKLCIAGDWTPSSAITLNGTGGVLDNAGNITAPSIAVQQTGCSITNGTLGYMYMNSTTTTSALQTSVVFTNSGTFITKNGFTNTIEANVINNTGAVIADSSTSDMVFGTTCPNITNNGTLWKNGGPISFMNNGRTNTNNGTIINNQEGNFDLGNGVAFTNAGTLTYQGTTLITGGPINNSGSWTNNYTGATVEVFKLANLVSFNNSGTFYNNKGDLTLYNGVGNSNSGTFTINNGNLIFTNTATITNDGYFNITGTGGISSPCNSAVFTNNGKVTIENGNLDWQNNGNVFNNNGVVSLQTAGNTVTVGGGTATINNNGRIIAPNMVVGAAGTMQNNCSVELGDFTLNDTCGLAGVRGPATADGYVGRFMITGTSTWTAGSVFGQAGQSIDFCDVSGGLDNGWDDDGDHTPGGTITHCTADVNGNATCDLVLPINLLYFVGLCNENNTITLQWATATETNNDKFKIERSFDGINYEMLYFVDGAGNSNKRIDYTINDYTSHFGVNYYRLTQVDYDGKFETFPVYAVTCEPELVRAKLTIFQNPIINNDVSFAIIGIKSQSVQIDIFDDLGHPIYHGNKDVDNNQLTTIKLSGIIAKGMYVIQVSSLNLNLVEKVFVK